MILRIYALSCLVMSLLAGWSCKTPPETLSEKPASVKTSTPQYEKGVLVFRIRDDYKGSLPQYDKNSPFLGEYPHLEELITTYKVRSIAPISPPDADSQAGKLYKIRFDESHSVEAFRKALEEVKIIEYVEKVPLNTPK